jgi:hypothetical protein
MIPTRRKAKLPRDWSYPIGAEALTKGLAGTPHAEALTVSFWHYSSFHRPENEPYVIFVAQHRSARKPGYSGHRGLVESGCFDQKWELTVHPVPSHLRQAAHQLLRERGLPLVVEWLRSSERPGWTSREQRITLVFSPTPGSISVFEDSGV